MSKVTLGQLLWETATGNSKIRKLSPEESEAIRKQISENVSDKIDQIRREQRRSLESTRQIVVR